MVLWSSEKYSKATHINDGSSPLSSFLLYFVEMITLLVVETNRYYHDHPDRLEEEPLPLPTMTGAKMLVFLAITTHMGHHTSDKLTDYWSTTTNSTHISTAVLWNRTDTFSSFILCTLQTIRMSLT
jgi:hypothetical protein